MPTEIEAKMSVPNFDAVRNRLRECGAQPHGTVMETNVFLDTEDRALLTTDEGLRIRENRDLQNGRQEHIVTYKGPKQMGVLKSREEVELAVDSTISAVALFQKLGFAPMLSFEKRRESWRLDDCKVELDELPHLGMFVEVEGPSDAAVLNVRETIGLSDRPIIKSGYASMLLSHLQERGQTTRTIRFA